MLPRIVLHKTLNACCSCGARTPGSACAGGKGEGSAGAATTAGIDDETKEAAGIIQSGQHSKFGDTQARHSEGGSAARVCVVVAGLKHD